MRGAVIAAALVLCACSLALSEGEFAGGPPEVTPADGGDAPTQTDGAASDAATTPDGTVVTRGLVMHYAMDETSGDQALDTGPNALHAKFQNGSNGPPARVAGKRGGALALGAGSYAEAARHPKMVVAPTFSVAFWANAPAEAGDSARIVTLGGSWDIKLNGRRMQLTFNANHAQVAFELPPDRWTHYAVVVTSGRADWFVDGSLKGKSSDTLDGQGPQPGTLPFRIGRYADGTWPYTGVLDDVRIYDVALTTTEVAQLAAP